MYLAYCISIKLIARLIIPLHCEWCWILLRSTIYLVNTMRLWICFKIITSKFIRGEQKPMLHVSYCIRYENMYLTNLQLSRRIIGQSNASANHIRVCKNMLSLIYFKQAKWICKLCRSIWLFCDLNGIDYKSTLLVRHITWVIQEVTFSSKFTIIQKSLYQSYLQPIY